MSSGLAAQLCCRDGLSRTREVFERNIWGRSTGGSNWAKFTIVGTASAAGLDPSPRDLIFYGIILVMPMAPIPMFGITQELSKGHCVTTILIAMAAMTLTAAS